MKKKIPFLTFTVFLAVYFFLPLFLPTKNSVLASKNYGWTRSIGGTRLDFSQDITTDVVGNSYTTGWFEGTVNFDDTGGTDIHTSTNGPYEPSRDLFITKHNPGGGYVWTRSIGGAGHDYGNSIATDSSGNVFITGSFEGTVNFDDTGGADYHTSNGDGDIFITKYNADGSYGWTRSFGSSTRPDYGSSIATDSNGNIFTTGYFRGTVNFDDTGGTDEHSSAGGASYNDIFITKYNADGSYGWTYSIGAENQDRGEDLTVDANDNILVTGSFIGTVNFDDTGGTDEHTSSGAPDKTDLFITKYNADGSYGWTKSIGGIASDYGNGIATDSSGNVFVTGTFVWTVNFDDTGGTDEHTSNGSNDIFITKYNADGSYGWTKSIGATSIYAVDIGTDITVDSDDNILTAGYFQYTVNFDDTGGTDEHTSNGMYDIFVTKYNADGSYSGTYSVGGSGSDQAHGVTTDSQGNIFTTGNFSYTVNFDDNGGTDNHTSNGLLDFFITKLKKKKFN